MKSTIRGMFMLGSGKREGIHEFSNTSDAVLSALAPWIALTVVSNLLPLLENFRNMHIVRISLSMFLVKCCCLLITVTVIHFFASLWKNEGTWKQTTAAVLWCFWVPIIDGILFFMIAGMLLAGYPNILMALLGVVGVLYFAYSVWLNWFVIKVGLQTTAQRSVIIIVALIFISIVIYSIFLIYNYSYMVQMVQELQDQIQKAKSVQ